MSGKGAQLWNSLSEDEEKKKKKSQKKRKKKDSKSNHPLSMKKKSLTWIKEIMYSAISTHTSKQTYFLETTIFKPEFLLRLHL